MVMMFGNSYKRWHDQFTEFMMRYFCDDGKGWRYEPVKGRVKKVERSYAKWKYWGGLKWCEEISFQRELNREGCQIQDHDNPNPRKYSDMRFEEVNKELAVRYLRDWK